MRYCKKHLALFLIGAISSSTISCMSLPLTSDDPLPPEMLMQGSSLLADYTYPAPVPFVLKASITALERLGLPVGNVSVIEARIDIITKSVQLNPASLQRITDPAFTFLTKSGGRLIVLLTLKQLEQADIISTQLSIRLAIVVHISAIDFNPVGGRLVPSNGTLESEISEEVSRILY